MSVCDVPVIATVCDSVGEGAASLVSAPFDWLAQAMGQAAAWLFEAVWAVLDTTTLVDVTGGQYVDVYNVLFGVAIFVMLIFFCLQLITGLVHRDPMALSRAAIGLAKSALGSFIAISLTATLLQVTDQLAIGVVQATGNTMEGMGDRITLLAAGLTTINIAAPGVGAIVTIFLAGLGIAAAAIVWFSLLVRKALLLVAIVFAPIALAGLTWDATKGWFAKWAAFVLALILSKLVLVVVFLVAIGQVSAPIDVDLASLSDPISGVVLMFIAAFAPYLTYKFISFVGFDMYHAMSSEQEAKSALNRPIPLPIKPQPNAARAVLDGQGGSGGSTRPAPALNAAATASPAARGAAAPGGGAAAAAGPAAAAVIGAQVVKAAGTAGPKAGAAAGGAAMGHADAAEPAAAPPATSASARTRVSVPAASHGEAQHRPPAPAPAAPRKG
jgi:type IV secretion system protein TrbL